MLINALIMSKPQSLQDLKPIQSRHCLIARKIFVVYDNTIISKIFQLLTLKFVNICTYGALFLICNIIFCVLNLYMYECLFVYMILVHSSIVAAILCQLPATSNPETVRGMCYAIIGLTSNHGANYK